MQMKCKRFLRMKLATLSENCVLCTAGKGAAADKGRIDLEAREFKFEAGRKTRSGAKRRRRRIDPLFRHK